MKDTESLHQGLLKLHLAFEEQELPLERVSKSGQGVKSCLAILAESTSMYCFAST
jgi:hypothetical protein